MTLAALKAKLIVLTGTSIGEVLFDWQEYLNERRAKTYPVVLWSLSGAKFKKDFRSAPLQPQKTITLQVFAIQSIEPTEDKITVWDTLEGKFDTYIRAMDNTAGIKIQNINELNCQYYGEGLLSVDSEIGIGFEVILNVYC